ncbi:integrase core domain-containing protein, partial [Corynebacterium pilbarense]
FSRPAISNDNPQMESLFHTMKGFAYYPGAFADIDAATQWVARFTRHYNNRPHSGINGYTPQSVLDGTWRQYETNRINATRAALEAGLITAMPKTPTGLPKEVTIIRTTTKTRPQPPTLTVA